MSRRKANAAAPAPDDKITDYRYDEKRRHIPPAGLAAQGKVRETPKVRYEYDPHLPPVLRFDASGAADRLPELLQLARQRPLTDEEARLLADSLAVREPWLDQLPKISLNLPAYRSTRQIAATGTRRLDFVFASIPLVECIR